MLPHRLTRLPLPHLFMTVSVGALTLMALAAGGPEGSVGILGSSLVFLALLATTVRVARGVEPGRGRPVLGLLAGLLTGLAGAASLLSVGAITARSPLWVYLPLVAATLATALGGRTSARAVTDSTAAPVTGPASISPRSRLTPKLSTGS